MIKVDFSNFEGLDCFYENRLIRVEDLQKYICSLIKNNNFCENDITINFDNTLRNNYYAYYDTLENSININFVEVVLDFIKKSLDNKSSQPIKKLFKKAYTDLEIIDEYNLSSRDITLCNLKVLETFHHELFHLISFNNMLKINKGKEATIEDKLSYDLAVSNMTHLLDATLDNPKYNSKHDMFYEEYLALTMSYMWTCDIIDTLNKDKTIVTSRMMKRFNEDAFKRIGDTIKVIDNDPTVNHNFTKRGKNNEFASNVSEYTNYYFSEFMPKCDDLFNHSLKEQSKILRKSNKLENYYLRQCDEADIIVYLANKEVLNKVGKDLNKDLSISESLVYGHFNPDASLTNRRIADMFTKGFTLDKKDQELKELMLYGNFIKFIDKYFDGEKMEKRKTK